MRQSWSDDRLDALNDRVDAGFARVDQQFARVDEKFARVDERFERLDAKIDAVAAELRREMKTGFDEINRRFDAMQQTIIRVGGGLVGVVIAGFISTQF